MSRLESKSHFLRPRPPGSLAQWEAAPGRLLRLRLACRSVPQSGRRRVPHRAGQGVARVSGSPLAEGGLREAGFCSGCSGSPGVVPSGAWGLQNSSGGLVRLQVQAAPQPQAATPAPRSLPPRALLRLPSPLGPLWLSRNPLGLLHGPLPEGGPRALARDVFVSLEGQTGPVLRWVMGQGGRDLASHACFSRE